jgi:hypothetical protein
MPLPTGYGLQVRGPANESILVPVCLPPGFELDSMMLCPEFFAPSARGGQKEAPPVAGEAPAAAPGSQPVDRIAGTMRYVFGSDQAYSSSVDRAEAEPPRPTPQPFTARRDVELHHLA